MYYTIIIIPFFLSNLIFASDVVMMAPETDVETSIKKINMIVGDSGVSAFSFLSMALAFYSGNKLGFMRSVGLAGGLAVGSVAIVAGVKSVDLTQSLYILGYSSPPPIEMFQKEITPLINQFDRSANFAVLSKSVGIVPFSEALYGGQVHAALMPYIRGEDITTYARINFLESLKAFTHEEILSLEELVKRLENCSETDIERPNLLSDYHTAEFSASLFMYALSLTHNSLNGSFVNLVDLEMTESLERSQEIVRQITSSEETVEENSFWTSIISRLSILFATDESMSFLGDSGPEENDDLKPRIQK